MKSYLLSFILTAALISCAHDKAWISDKTKTGGNIGYSQSAFFDEREALVKDFNKAATKLCGPKKWSVVREIIPPPTSAVGAIRNAANGNAEGTVTSGQQVAIHEGLYRSRRMNKSIKVEYGSPLKSWNEAEIKCEKN